MTLPIISRALVSVTTSNHLLRSSVIQSSNIHLSSVLCKKRAGRHKVSIKHDKPLTYEEAQKPDQIGVRKSWNSLNTSTLKDGLRAAESSHEDVFIRKFIHGTWPKLLANDVVIKRRTNQIIINFMVLRESPPSSMYFLTGYTEEILGYVLKCPVKLELQTIETQRDLVYKYI